MKPTRRDLSKLATAIAVCLAASAAEAAQPIRALLVMPTESGRLARQASRLNDSLVKSQTHIVASPSLETADAVVRVTGYRQTTDPNGELQNWWEVEIKLLVSPPPKAHAPFLPKRQWLVVFGREDWETDPVLDVLSEVVARGLGRRQERRDKGI